MSRPPHKPERPAFGAHRGRGEAEDEVLLYGIHAVEAALANPARRFRTIVATENAARRLEAQLTVRGIAAKPATPRDLDRRLGPDTVHQGVLAIAEPLPERRLEDLAVAAASAGPLLVLDQVTDPHNVGAILRSAAVFGAAGLVMTRRHSPPLAGALAKAASGALEHVPAALVTNLARALETLREAGVTVLGLDGDGPTLLEDEGFDDAYALVLGAEGKGLRQLTRESCDRLCRIATPGPVQSLNVSNAAAVALHLAAMRRRTARKPSATR